MVSITWDETSVAELDSGFVENVVHCRRDIRQRTRPHVKQDGAGVQVAAGFERSCGDGIIVGGVDDFASFAVGFEIAFRRLDFAIGDRIHESEHEAL
jgi:hypothetical protein